jgi:hypothetical protein
MAREDNGKPEQYGFPRDEVERFSSRPLSEDEIRSLRRLMKADERARWLWSSLRTWALWITAVSVGVASFKSFIIDFLNGKH